MISDSISTAVQICLPKSVGRNGGDPVLWLTRFIHHIVYCTVPALATTERVPRPVTGDR